MFINFKELLIIHGHIKMGKCIVHVLKNTVKYMKENIVAKLGPIMYKMEQNYV